MVVSEGEGDLLTQVTESPFMGLSFRLISMSLSHIFRPQDQGWGSFPTVHVGQEGSMANTQHRCVSACAPVLGLDFSCGAG